MVTPNQPKNKPDKERAQNSRDDLDLPPLTPEEEAYEKACDAIVDARLVSKFGPRERLGKFALTTSARPSEWWISALFGSIAMALCKSSVPS
jgi:hypothetical protein